MSTDDPGLPPGKPPRGFVRKHGLKLGLSLVIAAAFVWTFERGGLPLLPPAASLAKVNLGACFLYLLIFAGWHTVRATRWRLLLAPLTEVPVRRILAVSWIGYAAILLMPLRAGEF